MTTWTRALSRTRRALLAPLRRVLGGPDRAGEGPLEALEETLLAADVSPALAGEILGRLERGGRGTSASRREALRLLLVDRLPAAPFSWEAGETPRVVLVVGVNGAGKTTTCAKLARRVAVSGRRPLLAAADTFRAAGADQLRLWAERLGCDVVAGATGSDAAAVAFDAADAAVARGADWLLVDTAGRMHTRDPLMKELEKVRRALAKRVPGAPHETWMVLDAALGRNAVAQARRFHEAVPLTGVVVAKLDGSSKAGFVFSIAGELGLPVHFAGLGEDADDLVPFDPEAFVSGLLGEEGADAG